ncbi:MAG: aminoglycoside phosphotransferase [Robiginitomaculum sp.]|nr:MAG: aminoglycoside phosphotransferase [Robiginitomaculum sp.]
MRATQIDVFLSAHGWGDAVRTPVPGDASARRYERLVLDGKKAVLMDAPSEEDGPTCPLGASLAERKDLGYGAQAMLAGSDQAAFVCLASALTRRGFAAPHIWGADLSAGLLLLEDLGDDLYAPVLKAEPDREADLYREAVSCLSALYRSSFATSLQAHGATWQVGTYDNMALQVEADLFLDWYAPEFEAPLDADARADWTRIWTEAFSHLQAHATGLALRDFHAENIFAHKDRVGLIDFQDALFAHPSYDLVSLIEDARRDVDPALAGPLISQFCQQVGIVEDDSFHAAYAVQGAQRNAKILGIFVRLARRDKKPGYLDLLPRVRGHFQNDLSHPALAGLKAWVQKYAPTALEVSDD